MMPLSMVSAGEENTIQRIGGKEETRKFLETLGFVVGGKVTVVSQTEGNLIVNIKESRVAIGKDMANKIMVLWKHDTKKKMLIGGENEDIEGSSLRPDRKGNQTEW